LDITGIDEQTKVKLRGMIKFFSGDRTNILIQVIDNGVIKPCGSIYFTEEIQREFEELLGKERVTVELY